MVVHRRRTVQDLPFFDWLVRSFYPAATQDFILVARSCPVLTPHFLDNGERREVPDSQGALVGTVTVLPRDSGEFDRRRGAFIKNIDAQISAACDGRSLDSTTPDRTAEDIRMVLTGVPGASFTVSFALFRSGEFRLWFDMAGFVGRDIDAAPANELELKTAALLPAQVYYFVKDLLHAHYHHDSHQDQALPLDRLYGGTSDENWRQGEIAWRYASLRGLVRLVIELRQGRSFLGHKRALGIIAYAHAFQRTLAKIIRPRMACSPHESHDKIMPYRFEDLKMSIDAANAVAESSNTSLQQLFAIVVLIVLSALSLWAGAAQVAPALCGSLPAGQICSGRVPVWVIEAVNLIIANPPVFVLLLLFIGTVAFLWLFRGTDAVPLVYRFLRWAPKLYLALSVQIAKRFRDRAGYLVVLSGVVGIASILLAGSAWILLRRHPPSVERAAVALSIDRREWPDVFADVGNTVEGSGILVRGSVAPRLRQMLGEDYPAFVRQFGSRTPVRADGNLVFASSDPKAGGDGAYLLIDPNSGRIEAGLRRDGNLVIHRTGGRALGRPPSLLGFGERPADGDPVAPEATMCDIKNSASGRSVQMSGSLRVKEFCEYSVELKRGQTLNFDPRHANGLDVLAVDGDDVRTVRRGFYAKRDGRQVIHVVWLGGAQSGEVAKRPKQFYVRLDIR